MTDAEREALIEKMARNICIQVQGKDFGSVDPNDDTQFVMSVDQIELLERACEAAASVALAVALPVIRKDALEEAAIAAEHLNGWGSDCGRGGHAEHIAKMIRKLSEAE
jgi:hypothetical protein